MPVHTNQLRVIGILPYSHEKHSQLSWLSHLIKVKIAKIQKGLHDSVMQTLKINIHEGRMRSVEWNH